MEMGGTRTWRGALATSSPGIIGDIDGDYDLELELLGMYHDNEVDGLGPEVRPWDGVI